MANRYWVGGSGTWISGSTTNWSTSSGGSSGASTPTSSDAVIFDQSSTYTVSFSGTISCSTFTVSAGTVTFADAGTPLTTLNVNGATFSLVAGTVWTSVGSLSFGGVTATTNGTSISSPIQCSGSFILGSSLTTTGTFSFQLGGVLSLSLNSYTLTCTGFSGTIGGPKLNFGTGKIVCTGFGTVLSLNNCTPGDIQATGTKTVEFTYAGASSVTVRGPRDSGVTGSYTSADALNFYFKDGTYPLSFNTLTYSIAGSVDFTGYSGTATVGSTTNDTYFFGGLICSSGMTLATNSATWNFYGTGGSFTFNGKTLTGKSFRLYEGSWSLNDNFSGPNARLFSTSSLDLNGQTATTSSFFQISGTNTLTFNGGTISTSVFTGISTATTVAGTGTGKISITNSGANTFTGGGITYNCNLELAGAGAVTVSGSNTFLGITNAVQPASIKFTAGTTNTFGLFSLSGTAGNLVTIGSTTTSQATISTSSIVVANYLSISYSNATGTGQWYAGANSTDGGNNSGWIFSSFNSGFLAFF